MVSRLKYVLTALALLAASPALSGDAVLTVGHNTVSSPVDAVWAFDLETLQTLPVTRFNTSTTWTEGVQHFEGVSLHDLLAHLDVSPDGLRLVALDDYSVDIPVEDAVPEGAIIAYKRNGKFMPIREKGPLWLVYPYDANEEYQNEEHFARSIWQLARIELLSDD